MRTNLWRSQARQVTTGLSIKPKNNMEEDVFLFRGQNPLETHFQECPKSRKQGGAWASLRLPPWRPRAQQCQELLQGLITRSHREPGSLSCLLQKKLQEFSAGTLLACRGSRGRNESEGDVISLSCPSSLCLNPPSQVFCHIRIPGWQRQGGTSHVWHSESVPGDLHGPTGDGGFSFSCFTGFRKNTVSQTSYYPP